MMRSRAGYAPIAVLLVGALERADLYSPKGHAAQLLNIGRLTDLPNQLLGFKSKDVGGL